MPSEAQGGSGRTRARFPEVRAEIGEDPARWLDYPLIDDQDARRMARIRIRSIDTLEVARKWIEVEHELERGPRRKVIEWLRDRIVELEKIGQRPDRLQRRESRDVPEKQWYLVRAGERMSWDDVDRTVGLSTGQTQRAVADGGEHGN